LSRIVARFADMHTGVQIRFRPGQEERARALLTALREKLYIGAVPPPPEGEYHVIGLEAGTIQEAYAATVEGLDELDPEWRNALDVARPPDPDS
jgi:hypothetical protein